MAHIVHGVTTKRELRAALTELRAGAYTGAIWFENPSPFTLQGFSLTAFFLGESPDPQRATPAEIYVTNHPRRSWFARLRRTGRGKVTLE
jgi:hypothetical protein